MKHAYTCVHCSTIYDPTSQGHCPGCGRHPHLEGACDSDCDECDAHRLPPANGYLDRFALVGGAWQRVKPSWFDREDPW